MSWAVEVRRMWQDSITREWKANCFAYNVPQPAYPPYPGHEVLETWLDENDLAKSHQRLYNDGSSVLEVIFRDGQAAMLFALRWAK